MISHIDFGKLRLSQFLAEYSIDTIENWEFMERIWIGEAFGFSEWLRLEDDPEVLRSLSIDLCEMSAVVATRILDAIKLPVHAGMSLDQLQHLLGGAIEKQQFVNDRSTYKFKITEPHAYWIDCTILTSGGLAYLVVMIPNTHGQA